MKSFLNIFVSSSYKKIIFVIYYAFKARFNYESSLNWSIVL